MVKKSQVIQMGEYGLNNDGSAWLEKFKAKIKSSIIAAF